MILPVRVWPDPVLRQVCTPVTVFDDALCALADDMLETMYAAPGRGLAAPQVGVAQRLFVMDVTWKEGTPEPVICVNPEILAVSDEMRTGTEGCLSIPDTPMDVTRPAAVTLRWQGADGTPRQQTLTGFAATCAQHELDHLNGTVIFDRIAPDLRAALEAPFLS